MGNLNATQLENQAKTLAEGLSPQTNQYESGVSAPLTINKADFGLYLVVENTPPAGYEVGAPFFVDVPRTSADGSTWEYNIVATPKNGSKVLEKKVAVYNNNGTVADKTTDSVKTGDTLVYSVKGTLPYLKEEELAKDEVKITISDTLSDGLTFEDNFELDSFKINNANPVDSKDATNPKKYYEGPTLSDDHKTFTVTITAKKGEKNYDDILKYIKDNNGKSVEFTYKAKVTDALSYAKAGTNKATIDVKRDTKSESNIPEVYTYAIELTKKLGNDVATSSSGVQFELYKDAQCTQKVANAKIVDDNGKILFDGLVAEYNDGAGTTYYLKEIKTASGYTLLSKPVAVTLIPEVIGGQPTGKMKYTIDDTTTPTEGYQNSRLAETTITNNKGFNLPSTGGMGTYLFTIGGIIVMAGAVILLIASKKKRA